jgi:hypothetical protein
MAYTHIFPTCVFSDIQLELADKILPIANEYLEKHGTVLTKFKNHISTYKNKDVGAMIMNDPRMKILGDYIRGISYQYLNDNNVDANRYNDLGSNIFYLFNKIGKDSTHNLHAHPSSLLSGCFYLDACDDSPPLIFKDPRPYYDYVYYEPIFNRTTPYTLLPEFVVPVKKGMILLWPSWLAHEVPLSNSDGNRITVAFNVNG